MTNNNTTQTSTRRTNYGGKKLANRKVWTWPKWVRVKEANNQPHRRRIKSKIEKWRKQNVHSHTHIRKEKEEEEGKQNKNNSELIWLIQHLSQATPRVVHSSSAVCIFHGAFSCYLLLLKLRSFFLHSMFIFFMYSLLLIFFFFLCLFSVAGVSCSFHRTCEKNCFIQSPSEIPFPSHVLCKCMFWVSVFYVRERTHTVILCITRPENDGCMQKQWHS